MYYVRYMLCFVRDVAIWPLNLTMIQWLWTFTYGCYHFDLKLMVKVCRNSGNIHEVSKCWTLDAPGEEYCNSKIANLLALRSISFQSPCLLKLTIFTIMKPDAFSIWREMKKPYKMIWMKLIINLAGKSIIMGQL